MLDSIQGQRGAGINTRPTWVWNINISNWRRLIKNINQLAADDKRVRTSDLAVKTELKPATVTEMIQRLGDLGLVDYEAYHGVHLTKQGQHVADVIEHRFNILERFLTEILGVESNEASEVACRMEHVLTRDVEHKLTTFLGIDPQKESELFCHKINIFRIRV